jgi:hypothetical protein
MTVELEPTSGDDAAFDTDMTYQVTERIIGADVATYWVDVPTAASVDLGTLTTYETEPGVTRQLVVPDLSSFGYALDSRIDDLGVFNVKDYGAEGDGVTGDLTAINQAITAAEAAGPGTIVYIPSGVYNVETGLSLAGKEVVLRGAGAGGISRLGQTVLHAVTQSGPVLDLDGWEDPGSFTGRVTIGGFTLKGSGVGSQTTNVGLKIGLISSTTFRDIAVMNTAAAGIYTSDGPLLCAFEYITVNTPVDAGDDDIPYIYMEGQANGNLFSHVGLRSSTADNDCGESGAWIMTGDGTNDPTYNQFHHCWAEFLHPVTDGTILSVAGNMNTINNFQCWDTNRADAGATGTSFFRFRPAVNENYGGNLLLGVVPGDNGASASFAYGVIIEQPNNVIQGVKGYRGNNVYIASGVANCTVRLMGAVSGADTAAVVDDSGLTNNVVWDDYLGVADLGSSFDLGSANVAAYSDGGGARGIRVRDADDTTYGVLALGSEGARIQSTTAAPDRLYFTGDQAVFRNVALDRTPLTMIAEDGNAAVQVNGVNGATQPALRVNGFLDYGSGAPKIVSGADTPEGAITAPVGSIFLRTNGGANTTLYVKQTGAGNTGWTAVTP